MTNTETKQILDRLYGLNGEDMERLFNSSSIERILNAYYLDTIEHILNEQEKPKYGDVYINSREDKYKCIFLDFDEDDCVWYLSEKYEMPQKMNDLETFEYFYKKTGKNVADIIKGCF